MVGEKVVAHLRDFPSRQIEMQAIDESHVVADHRRHRLKQVPGLNHDVDPSERDLCSMSGPHMGSLLAASAASSASVLQRKVIVRGGALTLRFMSTAALDVIQPLRFARRAG